MSGTRKEHLLIDFNPKLTVVGFCRVHRGQRSSWSSLIAACRVNLVIFNLYVCVHTPQYRIPGIAFSTDSVVCGAIVVTVCESTEDSASHASTNRAQ